MRHNQNSECKESLTENVQFENTIGKIYRKVPRVQTVTKAQAADSARSETSIHSPPLIRDKQVINVRRGDKATQLNLCTRESLFAEAIVKPDSFPQ